ncbi:MAG: hypothetical protein R2708_19050 [Vicinamibacterales bacterium]
MSPKRPASAKPPSTSDDWKITDEWGIYDPEKAGIPALFKRLGRPVLRAAPSSARRERRRALRPQRSAEGVAVVLDEVRKRAGLLPADDHPLVGGNPARAMRLALKAQAAAAAEGTTAPAPYVPPPQAPEPPQPQQARSAHPAPESALPEPPAPARKRAVRRSAAPAQPVREPAPARGHRLPAEATTAAADPAAPGAARTRAQRSLPGPR